MDWTSLKICKVEKNLASIYTTAIKNLRHAGDKANC